MPPARIPPPPTPPKVSEIRLVPLSRANYRPVLALEAAPEQASHLPPTAEALLEAHFEGLSAYAVYAGRAVIGYVVLGEFAGVPWITRLLIDRHHQGHGLGGQVVRTAVRMLSTPHATEIRASVAAGNAAGKALFEAYGFVPQGALPDGEEVLVKFL